MIEIKRLMEKFNQDLLLGWVVVAIIAERF